MQDKITNKGMEALRSWADLLKTTVALNSDLARSIAAAYPTTPDFMEQNEGLYFEKPGGVAEMNKPKFLAVLTKPVLFLCGTTVFLLTT